MTMDVEVEPSTADATSNTVQHPIDSELNCIINNLVANSDIVFKSQQRGEADLTNDEKYRIASELFNHNKVHFLQRFGKYLTQESFGYFKKFNSDEIDIIMRDLQADKSTEVKNRRYEALKEMVGEGKYFSDTEMMKRNPLLYEQLVGRYLTIEEKQARDKEKMYQEGSFVKILMEGIERDDAEIKRREQEDLEEMDDSSSDDEVAPSGSSYSQWGEYDDEPKVVVRKAKVKEKVEMITAEERKLLKEEFITSMYQSFLDGKDEDFDYKGVDSNSKYDDMETIDHDEEEKYFDAEEPERAVDKIPDESSEDELDIYMSALNNHPAVAELSKDLNRL